VGTEREPRVGTSPLFWLVLAAILVVIAVGMWHSAFYTTQEGPAVGETREAGGTVEDIVANPERYMGEGVTVVGRVTEVLAPGAITVGAAGGESLLVVRREAVSPVPGDLQPNQSVQITGTVGVFRAEEMRDQLGATLGEEQIQQYQDEIVLMADSISRQ
jgi:hypothetical protein